MPPTLQAAFRKAHCPLPLPPALPVAHTTLARSFASILAIGGLKPTHCKIFQKNLLYFSYGGLFYRPKRLQTQHATELPVGLVFSPEALKMMTAIFPFDTGAVASHPRLSGWRAKLEPFKTRFRIFTKNSATAAPKLVKLLYATNRRYAAGRVSSEATTRGDPFPLLASFLGADLTPEIDHRQRSIECIAESVVKLGEHLEWIGMPERNVDKVAAAVYQWTKPRMPIIYTYRYTRNFNPAEVAAQLENAANEAIMQRYIDLKS